MGLTTGTKEQSVDRQAMPEIHSLFNSGSFDAARLKHLCFQSELKRSKQHEEELARFARWRVSRKEESSVAKDDSKDSLDQVDMHLLKRAVQKWSTEEESGSEEKEQGLEITEEEESLDSPASSNEESTTKIADNPSTQSSNDSSLLLTPSSAHRELAVLGRRLGLDSCLSRSRSPFDDSLRCFKKKHGIHDTCKRRAFGGDDPKPLLKFLSSLSDDDISEDEACTDELVHPNTLSTSSRLKDGFNNQDSFGVATMASGNEKGGAYNSRVPWGWIALAGCMVVLLTTGGTKQPDPAAEEVHALSESVSEEHDAASSKRSSLWCPNHPDLAMDLTSFSDPGEPSVSFKKLLFPRTTPKRDQLVPPSTDNASSAFSMPAISEWEQRANIQRIFKHDHLMPPTTDNISSVVSVPAISNWEKPANIQRRFRVAVRSRADFQKSFPLFQELSPDSTSTNGDAAVADTDLNLGDFNIESSYLHHNHTASDSTAKIEGPRPFSILFDSLSELFDMTSFLGSESSSLWHKAQSEPLQSYPLLLDRDDLSTNSGNRNYASMFPEEKTRGISMKYNSRASRDVNDCTTPPGWFRQSLWRHPYRVPRDERSEK